MPILTSTQATELQKLIQFSGTVGYGVSYDAATGKYTVSKFGEGGDSFVFDDFTSAANYLKQFNTEGFKTFFPLSPATAPSIDTGIDTGGAGPTIGREKAGVDVAQGGVFRRYLAASPIGSNFLTRSAALERYPDIRQQFNLANQAEMGNQDAQDSAFKTFLGQGAGVRATGENLKQRLLNASAIAGKAPSLWDAYLNSLQGGEKLNAVNVRETFGEGPNAQRNQFEASLLPFLQKANSPEMRNAVQNVLQGVFDRYLNANPAGNFLDYALKNNMGGLF